MPLKYQGQLNLGNAALGTEKTITANEDVDTVDLKALAREIHHQNELIPAQVAENVLENFAQAAAELMAMGFAIQFRKGNDVFMRIYPDIHVKGGNINLARARELDPTVTELTLENAGALIDKAGGVTVRVRAEVEKKFTDLLMQETSGIERKGIVEKAYVERKDAGEAGDDDDANGGTSQNGGSSQGGNTNGGGTSQQGSQGYTLNIGTSGSGSAVVTHNGNALTSGTKLQEDDEVEIAITPAEGHTPTATINGSEIELTENDGVYTGSFAMPAQASALVCYTGSNGGDGGDDLDKD